MVAKLAKIQVDPKQIQEMQQGYETRLSRQRDAIDRLVNLLHKRTDELADRMHEEVNEAAEIGYMAGQSEVIVTDDRPEKYGDYRGLDDLQQNSDLSMSGTQVAELLKIASERYDLWNEDDTPFKALRAYMNWCWKESQEQRQNQEALTRLVKEQNEELRRKNRELEQLRSEKTLEAQRNPVEEADDTPPWLKNRGHVAPTVIERQTIEPVDSGIGSTETLNDWEGANQLSPDESRPGGF